MVLVVVVEENDGVIRDRDVSCGGCGSFSDGGCGDNVGRIKAAGNANYEHKKSESIYKSQLLSPP